MEKIPFEPSIPGSSAQREHDRRAKNRKQALTGRFGKTLGKVAATVTDDPQHVQAWAKGAKGERLVGAFLEKKLLGTQCVVLHDRAMPRTRANIDHLVVGPAGVTVVDAKNISGKVGVVKRGFGSNRRTELHIDGRDRTKLVDGVHRQITQVESAIREMLPPLSVSVTGLICWWNGDGLPLFGNIELNGVAVRGKGDTVKQVSRSGQLSAHEIQAIGQFLSARFPLA